jgi:diacylglycerol kinase (ATP)
MRRIGAIVNRASGHGRGGHMERWLRMRLGEQLDLLEIVQDVDLAGWARERAALGVERILVFGGDGTFRAVADAMEGMELPLALVATGTNNNISRALGLPDDPYEATEIGLAGSADWISAGRITGYFCLEAAGIGLEAELWPVGEAVVRHRFRDAIEGPLALARTVPAAVEIDLEEPEFHDTVSAYTMTISNVAVTGAHLPLAPDVDIRDPSLYLNVYRSLGPMGTIRTGMDLARKRAMRAEFVTRHRFMRARIRASEPLNVHADGTLIGALPIDVVSIAKAVRVVMPGAAETGGPVAATVHQDRPSTETEEAG